MRTTSVLLLLASLSLTGCGGALPPAETSPGPGDESPDGTESLPDPGDLGTGYRYRFDMIAPSNDDNAITEREVYLWFWPDTARVNFRLENRQGIPIRIHWEDCRFTTTEGITYRCIHEGITYDRRHDPQNFTEISGLDRYHDWIAPVDLLDDPKAARGEGMRLLFPTDVSALSFVDKTFSIDLMLEIENERRPYRLVFQVDSVLPPR